MSNKSSDRFRDPMEDRGWQQMEKILDREMPVNRRLFAWWYWTGAAAAVIMIGVAAAFLLQRVESLSSTPDLTTNKHENSKSEIVLSEELEVDKGPAGKEELATNQAPINSNNTLSEKSKRDDLIALSDEKKQQSVVPDRSVPTNSTKDIETEDKKSMIDLGNQKSIGIIDINVAPSPMPKPLIIEDGDNSGGWVASEANRGSLNELDFLVKHNFSPVFIPSIYLSETMLSETFQKSETSTISIDRNPGFDFAAESALISETQFAKWSFDAGANVRYQLNDKIAVGTGAYFWKINANQEYFSKEPDLGFQAMDRANVLVPEMDTLGSAYGNMAVGRVNNLSYFRLPLLLQFFPNQTWQPRVGISQLMLLNNSDPGRISPSRDLVNQNQVIELKDFVRKTNLSYVVGLTFRPGNHLYFDLSYQHGKASYLNYPISSGRFLEFHRYMRLAAGFQF